MSGYVYFVTTGNADRVKIGYTASRPEIRLKALQTGSPFELCIIATERGGPDRERDLHGRFAKYRLHGEWFELRDELKTHIKDRCLAEYDEAVDRGHTPPKWARMMRAMADGLTMEQADAL